MDNLVWRKIPLLKKAGILAWNLKIKLNQLKATSKGSNKGNCWQLKGYTV